MGKLSYPGTPFSSLRVKKGRSICSLKSAASRLFTPPFIQAQIKENIKCRVTGLCAGNGELSAQMASNAENVSIWWRHHVFGMFDTYAVGVNHGEHF